MVNHDKSLLRICVPYPFPPLVEDMHKEWLYTHLMNHHMSERLQIEGVAALVDGHCLAPRPRCAEPGIKGR